MLEDDSYRRLALMRNWRNFVTGPAHCRFPIGVWAGQNELGGLCVRFETKKPATDVGDFRTLAPYMGGLWTGATHAWNTIRHPSSSPPRWLFRVDGSADADTEGSSALLTHHLWQAHLL